jgi:hypothetical protein
MNASEGGLSLGYWLLLGFAADGRMICPKFRYTRTELLGFRVFLRTALPGAAIETATTAMAARLEITALGGYA